MSLYDRILFLYFRLTFTRRITSFLVVSYFHERAIYIKYVNQQQYYMREENIRRYNFLLR